MYLLTLAKADAMEWYQPRLVCRGLRGGWKGNEDSTQRQLFRVHGEELQRELVLGALFVGCLFAEPCKNRAYLCADWTESVEHSSHVGILKNMQNRRPYPEDLDSAGQG